MFSAWVLTVTMWVAQGGVSNQYYFASREQCIAAQKWYAETTKPKNDRIVASSCYPSLVPSK
jgi:hypothetical protein